MEINADLTLIAALAYNQLTEEEKETVTTDYEYLMQETVKKEKREMNPAELHFIEKAQEILFEMIYRQKSDESDSFRHNRQN